MVKKLLKKATGNPLVTGVIAVVVIGLLAVLLIPGLGESIGNAIFGSVSPCQETPYDSDCFCSEEEERFGVSAFGLPKFLCEPLVKFINPADLDWETQANDYIEEVLLESYPSCNSIACNQGLKTTIWSWIDFERRVVFSECLTLAVPQQRLNHVIFSLLDGTVDSSSCGDFVPPEANEPETTIEFLGYGPGFDMVGLFIRTQCNGIGTVDERYTHTLPNEGDSWVAAEAVDWWFHERDRPNTKEVAGGFYFCELENETTKTVTVHCTGECGGGGGIGADITLRYERP